MKNKLYVTTTLPYVNASPHVGHALEFFQADAIARYWRKRIGKDNVKLNIGTDEHGLKVYQKALADNKTPEEYTDYFADKWKEFCKLFDISYDSFYRTSDASHTKPAQEFWKRAFQKGDIYKKKYEALYCVGCESFKTDKDLVDGKCPDHDKEPVVHSEENYFFKLSKYTEPLLKWLDQNEDFVKPQSKYTELYKFIENSGEGLEDISISRLRENLPWGVAVPEDPEQVMYVWFDALTNYVAAVGFPDNDVSLSEWWPGIQLCGPDNLRFQGAIWQGMLESADLPHTSKLLVHGTILGPDGKKMSKTIGNVVDPIEQLEKFGVDAVRYYMLAGLTTYGNTPYIENSLIDKYNSDLADNLGNLLNRVIHLSKKFETKINDVSKLTDNTKLVIENIEINYISKFESFEIQGAFEEIALLLNWGNKHIDQTEPWKNKDQAPEILNDLSVLLAKAIDLLEPAIPSGAQRARIILMEEKKEIAFPKIEIS